MRSIRENPGPLEDRLRNMIISNSNNNEDAPPGLPPSNWPALSSQDRRHDIGLDHQDSDMAAASQTTDLPSKPSRKRPNQAQRRKMSAQLSIPVDRAYASPSTFPGQQHGTSSPRRQHAQHPTTRNQFQVQGQPNPQGVSTSFPVQGRHQQSLSYGGPTAAPNRYDWGHQPGQNAAFTRRNSHGFVSSFEDHNGRPPPSPTSLYVPGKQYHIKPEDMMNQAALLESLSETIVANAEIKHEEIMEKEAFRARIEKVCRDVITQHEQVSQGHQSFPPGSVQLRCFGSLMSGFATKASDMDLGLLSPFSTPQPDETGSPIPRLIEKAFLDIGLGARLLTRTRVPIIKLCEKPPDQLRQDLLLEREKWEKGVDDEPDVAEDDAHDETDIGSFRDTEHVEEPKNGHAYPDTGGQIDPQRYQAKLASLKQGEKMSLAAYYGIAKRLLRRLGGRDITHSNAVEFSEEDFKMLTDVCHAFLRGLSDHDLRDRLGSYRSLAFLSCYGMPDNYPNFRSLAGVFSQVEGEKLAIMWDSREVREKNEHLEQAAQNRITAWRELQEKPTFGLNLLNYNKELQLTLEQVRRIPSLQIKLLEQDQYESAAQYHYRTVKLLLELGGNDSYDATNPTANNVLSTVMKQYASGVWQDDIRREVVEFAQTAEVHTLRAVARRHKSLQIAHEFEKAIGKGFYSDNEREDIRAYVALLRRPLQPVPGDNHFDLVVPVTTKDIPLANRVRLLRNPADMAPNQQRDPYRDRLEFPKSGAGVQCDINFSAHLALQNTTLLRCYSHTDPRVRPLVLFVKHWAKLRGINTPYRGTLSSYGYVLMMLHYLVNVAHPFVCPNLQELAPPLDPNLTPQQIEESVRCKGCNIQFWRDEGAIVRLAQSNSLNQNRESIGQLLRGFFEFYAQNNIMSAVHCRGFDWGRDVLSLRTRGGLRTKQEKGWVGAKTTIIKQQREIRPSGANTLEAAQAEVSRPASKLLQTSNGDAQSQPQSSEAVAKPKPAAEFKEVRHRYLFAIEDPFELDHNVARTVTHNGIVAIRDEFRRAWRIIKSAGQCGVAQEDLLSDIALEDKSREEKAFAVLLYEIHGGHIFDSLEL